MSHSGDGEPERVVKSSARTLSILEVLASSPNRLGLGELAQRLDIPKSSLHALLQTMLACGWIEADRSGTRFGLGLRALQVGAAYVDRDDQVALAADTLDWLADELDETIHHGRLDGIDVIYLAKRESSHQLRLFSAVGRRLPAYATALGKALLAERPAASLSAHLPRRLGPLTERTITDRAGLMAELEVTRDRGFAIDDEESTKGICCVAVALPLAHPPTDAISCSVPTARLQEERRNVIVQRLLEARKRVTARAPWVDAGVQRD